MTVARSIGAGEQGSERSNAALTQLTFLASDVARLMNMRTHRWLTCWFRLQFWAYLSYRLERALYLSCGDAWPIVRLCSRPVFGLLRPSTVDIDCRADIGPGCFISHPALGIVISCHAVIGKNSVFTGGNCIGIRREFEADDKLTIGDDVNLGANAVVLGPCQIGSRVRVGAGVVVRSDVPDEAIVRSDWPADSRREYG